MKPPTGQRELRRCRWHAAVLMLGVFGGFAAAADAPSLAFRLDEGRNINSFVRAGDVAAHLLLRSGEQP